MDSRATVQSKQEAIAAIKAAQYREARDILQKAQDASPGGKLQDLLLADILNTLQQKVAQDEATSSEGEDESLDSDSDCTSTADDSNSGTETDSDKAGDESDSSTPLGVLQQTVAASSTSAQAVSSCQHSFAHNPVLGSGAQPVQQQRQDPECDAAAAQQQGCSLPALDEPQEAWPDLGGIQLAAGSCCLSHEERAHLRQQLAAGLEEQKTAAVLEKALENDPLLSMSLS